MKLKKNSLFLAATLFMCACGNDEKTAEKSVVSRQELIEAIKRGEKELYASMEIDNAKANITLANYVEFANQFPDDTLTPVFLFKAAEIGTATAQYPQAYEYYKKITDKYPNYKLVQESLYLQAYLLDNFLNDDEKARIVYEQVIQKYPDSHFAKDAKNAINNLGKTDEQLIEEFKKKNGEK
jgi:TolA-binding protein